MHGMRQFIRMFLDALVSRCDSPADLAESLAMLDADIALLRAERDRLALIPVNGKHVAGVN